MSYKQGTFQPDDLVSSSDHPRGGTGKILSINRSHQTARIKFANGDTSDISLQSLQLVRAKFDDQLSVARMKIAEALNVLTHTKAITWNRVTDGEGDAEKEFHLLLKLTIRASTLKVEDALTKNTIMEIEDGPLWLSVLRESE